MENTYLDRYSQLFNALSTNNQESINKLLGDKDDSFVCFIEDYILDHGLVKQTIMRKADIAVSYGYKLLTGEKHTKNRNVILRLCIAMQMTMDEIQKSLSLYGMNGLNDSRRDTIISTGIAYRKTIDEIDDWLLSLDMEPLMDSYDK